MLHKKLLPLALLLVCFCPRAEASLFDHLGVHGVVVNKTFRATPLSHSLGVEGIYKLEVRDEKNKIRRQMVTRELFLAYEIGDQFAPAGAPPTFAERAQRRAAVARIAKKDKGHVERIAKKNKVRPAPIAKKDEIRIRVRRARAVVYREPKGKLIVAAFPQEMLPETEGF